LIFPEGRHAVDFEGGAEALSDFVRLMPGEILWELRETHSETVCKGSCGDNSGAAGHGVVGETVSE